MTADSERLIDAMARDQRMRAELDARGLLYRDGYNPEMQEVHGANADLLAGIVARHGWPDTSRFGAEAATAAWMIAQHAIARPDFMRACRAAMKAGGAAGWQIAMIEDRIAVFEGRPQSFGTQFDLDDNGELVAEPIADPDTVDARRAAIGLEPLDKAARRQRAEMGRPPQTADRARRRRDYAQWLLARSPASFNAISEPMPSVPVTIVVPAP